MWHIPLHPWVDPVPQTLFGLFFFFVLVTPLFLSICGVTTWDPDSILCSCNAAKCTKYAQRTMCRCTGSRKDGCIIISLTFVFIWLLHIALFCRVNNRDSVSLFRFPLLSHVWVTSCAIPLFCCLKHNIIVFLLCFVFWRFLFLFSSLSVRYFC